jgi:CDP-4-dehydro-6-deoxyglucose reductase
MPAITLSSGSGFSAEAGATILDAGALAGVHLSYSCKNGRCSSCKCKVIQGNTLALQAELGLSDAEKNDGWILSCVRTAITDVVLDANDLGGVDLPVVKTWPCRISSIEKLATNIVRVVLRLPPSAAFWFIPGQYVELIGYGGVRRSYSLANATPENNLIELHIRYVDGGVMSQYWFDQAKVDDLLRLNGPMGTFFLRETEGLDVIFLATGTGIAPIKAILESLPGVSATQRPRTVTVLWGGRIQEDMYFDVVSIPGVHEFVPVLSRSETEWMGKKGYVQDALLTMRNDFSNTVVYACGSDAMIRSAKSLLLSAGLLPSRFHSDAFVCSASH